MRLGAHCVRLLVFFRVSSLVAAETIHSKQERKDRTAVVVTASGDAAQHSDLAEEPDESAAAIVRRHNSLQEQNQELLKEIHRQAQQEGPAELLQGDTEQPGDEKKEPQKDGQIPALIIHMPKNADRWDKINSWLGKTCLVPELLNATNGKEQRDNMEGSVTKTWKTDFNMQYAPHEAATSGKDIEMTDAERGCSMSHVRAWQIVADRNVPMVVLEDDASPGKTSMKNGFDTWSTTLRDSINEMPKETDLLYLAYILPPLGLAKTSTYGKKLLKIEYVWTTTGYYITPEGARKLLATLPVDQPVDNWMATHIAKKQMVGYATWPKLIVPAEAWGVASSVGHSDNEELVKGVTPTKKNFLVYPLNLISVGVSISLMFFVDLMLKGTWYTKMLVISLWLGLYALNFWYFWKFSKTRFPTKLDKESLQTQEQPPEAN